jgi:tmRNA-binding protein
MWAPRSTSDGSRQIPEGERFDYCPRLLYGKGKVIKLQLAVARGKKTFDKRETLKKRDLDREERRAE